MAKTDTQSLEGDVWFAYDGECPICTFAANALQIRKTAGALHLVNARDNAAHPLIQEVNALGYDLDDGMVLKFQGVCYHGEDALHMMALLGSSSGWFNRLNALLFRSRTVARFCYPAMRGTRNLLLRPKGISRIRNLQNHNAGGEPIFKAVFGEDWDRLPKVMRDHYAVRPFSDDVVVVEGALDIEVSPFMKIMSRLSGMLVSRSGENVPVTVTFTSGRDTADFHFDRVFRFPGGNQMFRSRMTDVGGNELVEFIGFGIGWKMAYGWDGERITLSHRGYVWSIFGFHIPIPLGLVIGKGEAEERPVSENEFTMWTHSRHPWFGESFAYAGTFEIVEVTCQDPS